MEFEVLNVEKRRQRLQIEIELTETRERRFFGYPLNEGWENEINGELKFIRDIKKKLQEEEEVETAGIDLESLKKKVKGKKIKTNEK